MEYVRSYTASPVTLPCFIPGSLGQGKMTLLEPSLLVQPQQTQDDLLPFSATSTEGPVPDSPFAGPWDYADSCTGFSLSLVGASLFRGCDGLLTVKGQEKPCSPGLLTMLLVSCKHPEQGQHFPWKSCVPMAPAVQAPAAVEVTPPCPWSRCSVLHLQHPKDCVGVYTLCAMSMHTMVC